MGLIALEDPPRDGVDDTIFKMKRAGIKVVMITGDNAITAQVFFCISNRNSPAQSISRQVNLLSEPNVKTYSTYSQLPIAEYKQDHAIVIHGAVVDHLTSDDWFNIFNYKEIVFARVLPTHKLDIVVRAQSLGHIVGVTGDGVNDSAALKQADLGIAMNSGSDISKESARMILLDDNFNSALKGIREGTFLLKPHNSLF